jgi:hypothetical protein
MIIEICMWIMSMIMLIMIVILSNGILITVMIRIEIRLVMVRVIVSWNIIKREVIGSRWYWKSWSKHCLIWRNKGHF